MDHGRVRQIGPTAEMIAAYRESVGAPPSKAA
jgi:hypothetical protein